MSKLGFISEMEQRGRCFPDGMLGSLEENLSADLTGR
jgi:hypothetical protein